jgi:hypothetical protein
MVLPVDFLLAVKIFRPVVRSTDDFFRQFVKFPRKNFNPRVKVGHVLTSTAKSEPVKQTATGEKIIN